jgi:4-hydroxy-2-oxoheptanedioate aldolase
MPAPKNLLKAALHEGRVQYGLWLNLASAYSAELLAGAGFDWLLIDAEHGPNSIPLTLAQVQAIGARVPVVVRPPIGETRIVKQVLDLGAQTLLIPMVESAGHAAEMAKAMLYPPQGTRGVASSVVRASDFGRISDYMTSANAETCLILQVENRAGLAALPAILAQDNIDGVFIGPADLAADMGHPGNASAPEVQAAVDSALRAILASGKAAGILTFDLKAAARYRDMGVTFIGIGGDIALLAKSAATLIETARSL